MIRHFRRIVPASLLLAACAAFSPLGAQNVRQNCIADWSEAGPIVRREGLATIERVGRLARDRASVEIVDTALCSTEGRYVYRLMVRNGQGVLRVMFVDAHRPFER